MRSSSLMAFADRLLLRLGGYDRLRRAEADGYLHGVQAAQNYVIGLTIGAKCMCRTQIVAHQADCPVSIKHHLWSKMAALRKEAAKTAALALLTALLPGCSRLPLVRDCGALVGGHHDAAEFSWAQPCGRADAEGCAETCRRAKDLCEAARAAFREEPRGQSEGRVRGLADDVRRECQL